MNMKGSMRVRAPFSSSRDQWSLAGALILVAVTPVLFFSFFRMAWVAGDQLSAQVLMPIPRVMRVPPQPVRGIYLTAHTAGIPDRREALFSLVDRSELNSVVIDLKNADGTLAYATTLPFANEYGLVAERAYAIEPVLSDARKRGIWTIGRLVVAEDPALSYARPDLALRRRDGGVWKTRRGVPWLDPTKDEVWEYAAALARDALRRGFDEVQFDYVRFPSDGALADAVFSEWSAEAGVPRYAIIGRHFRSLRSALGDDAVLSVDLFGMTMLRTATPEDDLGIGQRLADALPVFDAVSPMVYPSHSPAGFEGYANPAARPADVVAASLDAAVPMLGGSFRKIRPWLQDFDLGARYTPGMVRVQIDAVEVRGAAGWLLWNPANRYSESALRRENEIP